MLNDNFHMDSDILSLPTDQSESSDFRGFESSINETPTPTENEIHNIADSYMQCNDDFLTAELFNISNVIEDALDDDNQNQIETEGNSTIITTNRQEETTNVEMENAVQQQHPRRRNRQNKNADEERQLLTALKKSSEALVLHMARPNKNESFVRFITSELDSMTERKAVATKKKILEIILQSMED